MLKPNELFNLIKDGSGYKTVGTDVQYKLVIKDDILYLLFQESRSEQDWKTNFNFPVKCYKNQVNKIYGHRGFINAWKSCNNIVMNDLLEALDINKDIYSDKIVIAGWSFGGAMAQLAVEDFYFRTKQKPILITFGSPKIIFSGKKVFENACTVNSVQYAHKNDIVPLVPPMYFSFNRKKVGKFSFKKLWRTSQHCIYGEENLYS